MPCRLIVATGLAALVAVLPLSAAEESAPSGYRVVEITAGHFRCEVPEGWYFDRDEQSEARIHYHGFYVHGPKGDEDLGPSLSVRFFAPDNTLFAGPEGYLKRQLGPSLVKPADEKTSEPRKIVVAGRSATTFTRDTFEFFPPESLDTKRIPVREEHFVVPHLGGFIIVRFEAPTASYGPSRKALARLLATLQLLPETTVQTVRITSPGLSLAETEERVADRAEKRLQDIPDVTATGSVTFRGACVLVLSCKSTADVAEIRQEARRRLTALLADLPPGTEFELEPALPGGGAVLGLALSTSDVLESCPAAIAQLTALAARTVRSRLATVPGVAQVAFTGAESRYEVTAIPERLAENDVDLRDLIAAVRNQSKPARGAEPDNSIDDLSHRSVAFRNGRTLTIGDLAAVRLATFEPALVDAPSGENGADEDKCVVQLCVRNSPDTDDGAVYRAVEQALDEVRTTLPPGVRLEESEVTASADPIWQTLGIAHGQFVLKIIGADLTAAANAAEEVHEGLEKIAGLVEVTVIPAVRPSRRITIRREQAMRYGFDEKAIDEIAIAVEAIVDRRSVARVTGPHGLPIDVAVTTAGDEPAAIGRLTLQTPDGSTIPLTAMADFGFVTDPVLMLHEQGRRVVLVTGRIKGRDSTDAGGEIEAMLRTVRLPDGLSIEMLKND